MTRQELAEAQKLLVEIDSLYAVQEQGRNSPKLATLLESRVVVVREQLADLGVDETLTKETP